MEPQGDPRALLTGTVEIPAFITIIRQGKGVSCSEDVVEGREPSTKSSRIMDLLSSYRLPLIA